MHFLLSGVALLLTSGANEFLIDAAMESYWTMAKLILPLVAGTALLRILLNQLSFGNYGALREILRDTVKIVIYIALAPVLIKNALLGVAFMTEQIIDKSHYSAMGKVLNQLSSDPSEKEKGFSLLTINQSMMSDGFQYLVRGSVLFISTLLNYLRDMILAVFVSAMPLFLYIGLMLGLRFFANAVLSMGITLLIWPILSSLLMNLSIMVFKAESPSAWSDLSQCISLMIYAGAQLLLPFLVLGGGIMAASSIRQGASSIGSSLLKLGGK